MPSYAVLGSMVPELHAMRIVSLLKTVTPAWITNTVPFLLVIDYTCYSGSFEVLQAKVKCHSSVGHGSACPYTNITWRVVDQLMYLSWILFKVDR